MRAVYRIFTYVNSIGLKPRPSVVISVPVAHATIGTRKP